MGVYSTTLGSMVSSNHSTSSTATAYSSPTQTTASALGTFTQYPPGFDSSGLIS